MQFGVQCSLEQMLEDGFYHADRELHVATFLGTQIQAAARQLQHMLRRQEVAKLPLV